MLRVGLIAAARVDTEIGAEIITKRRKNIKKEMINAEKRRKRMERLDSLENGDDQHAGHLEVLVEEDTDESSDDDVSLSTVDSHDGSHDDMYVSATDPPSSQLQSEMMVS